MTPHILVAEDEDSLATLLNYNLEKEGYAVAVAADGEDALMMIDEKLPDLILLDWMLPKWRGDRPDPRSGHRRRRLHRQTLLHVRAVGPHPRRP